MREPLHHPHCRDQHGVVHIGNFTGPFTACGMNHALWQGRDKDSTPPTCVECLNYCSRNSA